MAATKRSPTMLSSVCMCAPYGKPSPDREIPKILKHAHGSPILENLVENMANLWWQCHRTGVYLIGSVSSASPDHGRAQRTAVSEFIHIDCLQLRLRTSNLPVCHPATSSTFRKRKDDPEEFETQLEHPHAYCGILCDGLSVAKTKSTVLVLPLSRYHGILVRDI